MPAQRKHDRERRRKGERRRRQQIAWEDLPQFESMKPRPGDAGHLLAVKLGRKRSTSEAERSALQAQTSPATAPLRALRSEPQDKAQARRV